MVNFESLMLVCAISLLLGMTNSSEGGEITKGPLQFKMEGIDGKQVDLQKFKGKVVLFVNVASECGYTPQYKGLQKLHEQFGKEGLVVIGVPSNDFGQQEPGSNKEIAQFCKANYGVGFVMLAKVKVVGKGLCPLYEHLTGKATNKKSSGPVRWNFEKFLIGRNGEIVARFDSATDPESSDLINAIRKELSR